MFENLSSDSFCEQEIYNNLGDIDRKNEVIKLIRNIIYSCIEPFVTPFFYWTILLLILHKFNFKKPVLKIIVAHYILRVIGDIFDSFGSFFTYYYKRDPTTGQCLPRDQCSVGSAEGHPLRWLLTRQVANIFWYGGEIAGDWYPLLRTRAVAREQKSIWLVYVSCGLFNLSKISMIVLHFTINGKDILDEEKKENFYANYWILYTIILVCSIIYDISVFWVLKRQIFRKSNSNYGFLKKFRTISEYRIMVSVIIGILGLPLILISTICKFIWGRGNSLDFSLEDLRITIVNVAYYMMFIDQIMLFRSRDDSSVGESNTASSTLTMNNMGSSLNSSIKPGIGLPGSYPVESKVYFSNLNNLNTSNAALNSNSQSNLMNYTYTNANANGFGRMKSNGNGNGNGMNRNNTLTNSRNNSIGNYDDYNANGLGNNEWNYLRH